MGTRSFIGKMNSDNSITSVYCHFDGYPQHNGKILTTNYITQQQVDCLLTCGDMSVLGPTLDQCSFYKDMGERYIKAKDYETLEQFIKDGQEVWVEYFYVFNHDFWSCYNSDGKRIDLHETMEDDEEDD